MSTSQDHEIQSSEQAPASPLSDLREPHQVSKSSPFASVVLSSDLRRDQREHRILELASELEVLRAEVENEHRLEVTICARLPKLPSQCVQRGSLISSCVPVPMGRQNRPSRAVPPYWLFMASGATLVLVGALFGFLMARNTAPQIVRHEVVPARLAAGVEARPVAAEPVVAPVSTLPAIAEKLSEKIGTEKEQKSANRTRNTASNRDVLAQVDSGLDNDGAAVPRKDADGLVLRVDATTLPVRRAQAATVSAPSVRAPQRRPPEIEIENPYR